MRWSAFALSVAVVAACGSLTAGGLTGEATVVVSGDADTLSAAVLAGAPVGSTSAQLAPRPSPVALASESGPALSFHENEVEGHIQVEFLAYLVTESGASIQLGEELQVQVDLKGRIEVDAVDRQLIPARRYTEFRLVFIEIRAEVEGLVIDGEPVPEVRIEMDDVSLPVSRDIDLDVTPGARAELVVDLNALAWLDAVDPQTGTVDEMVFQELVNVAVR